MIHLLTDTATRKGLRAERRVIRSFTEMKFIRKNKVHIQNSCSCLILSWELSPELEVRGQQSPLCVAGNISRAVKLHVNPQHKCPHPPAVTRRCQSPGPQTGGPTSGLSGSPDHKYKYFSEKSFPETFYVRSLFPPNFKTKL